MKWAARSYEKELLDADHIPFADIKRNMQELNTLNNFLGGHKITCKGIGFFLDHLLPGGHLTIAEIGCGGGDNLFSVHQFLARKSRPFSLIGVDLKEECIQFARHNSMKNVQWICSDYRTVKWPAEKPDIIFSSLFCHHFTDEQLVEQLRWLKENSRVGFFINDLHRHFLAYYSIRLIVTTASSSYLLKNDAPLSVRRAFKKKEWQQLMAAAGIENYYLKWHWAFRYLICVQNER